MPLHAGFIAFDDGFAAELCPHHHANASLVPGGEMFAN